METSTTINDELLAKVEKALLTIKPYLEADGGDVKVIEITDDYIVRLELLGACGSCPMSAMTMKAGIEEAIMKVAPEVIKVEAINLTQVGDPGAKLPNE